MTTKTPTKRDARSGDENTGATAVLKSYRRPTLVKSAVLSAVTAAIGPVSGVPTPVT
jgi:hypothetical protein